MEVVSRNIGNSDWAECLRAALRDFHRHEADVVGEFARAVQAFELGEDFVKGLFDRLRTAGLNLVAQPVGAEDFAVVFDIVRAVGE